MRTKIGMGLAWLLLLPALLWAAPAAKATAAKGAAAPAMTDAQLEQAIRARFARSKIQEEKFQVHVQNGTAILEGKTKIIQRKATATRLARLAGARSVKNKIEIDEAARQAALDNLQQGRRRVQVKRSDARSEKSER
ncbi:MAG: BON domain-containing protein [Bryobacteraceae bacterium]